MFALLLLGVAGFVAARVIPSLWTLPERLLAAAMQHIGHWLFKLVLTALYIALVTPLGFIVRLRTKETFVQWHGVATAGPAAWSHKEITADSVFDTSAGSS